MMNIIKRIKKTFSKKGDTSRRLEEKTYQYKNKEYSTSEMFEILSSAGYPVNWYNREGFETSYCQLLNPEKTRKECAIIILGKPI